MGKDEFLKYVQERAQPVGVLAHRIQLGNEDIASLHEIILYGIKGTAAISELQISSRPSSLVFTLSKHWSDLFVFPAPSFTSGKSKLAGPHDISGAHFYPI